MDLRKRSDWVGGLRVTVMMSIVMLVALCGILMPQTADAQPVKKATTKCSQCHNGALDPGMTVHATVNGGVEGTCFAVAPGATIEIDFLAFVTNVVVGQERLNRQVDIDVDRQSGRHIFESEDGCLQHLAIKLVAHGRNVPALLSAQQIPRAPQFQITHGDREAGSHLAEFLDRTQATCRFG